MADLYTIGYANKTVEKFINELQANNINCIVDVRSTPYSKQYPEYNSMEIKRVLLNKGIRYLSFKNEFGARRIEPEVYERKINYDNSDIEVVIFQKVFKTNMFLSGVERIKNGVQKGYKIAFMCAEKNPFDCHRCIMISEYFFNIGFNIIHIYENGETINHKEIAEELKSNFDKAKSKFEKLNENKLNNNLYANDIFGNSTFNNTIKEWETFFKSYDYQKGIYLRNLEIGYKKGDVENE